jgi:DNA-directed RNA polymerase specialized sigma54-like protein
MDAIFDRTGKAAGNSLAGGIVDGMKRAMEGARKEAQKLQVEAEKLRADDIKRVRDLREEFNPAGKAARDLAELRRIQRLGGFDKDPSALAFARRQILDPLLNPVANRTQGAAVRDSQDAVQAIIGARVAMAGENLDRAAADRQKQIRLAADQLQKLETMLDALQMIHQALPGAW